MKNQLTENNTKQDNEANGKAKSIAQTIPEQIEEINSPTVVYVEKIVYVGVDLKGGKK